MSCWSVNSFDFAREKLHEHFSTSVVFPAKLNESINKTCFVLIMHLLSIWATTSWKMLMNNKIKTQTLTANPTPNLRCNVLASHALNMSCSFGQSANLTESRCVVRHLKVAFRLPKSLPKPESAMMPTLSSQRLSQQPPVTTRLALWQLSVFNNSTVWRRSSLSTELS